MNGSGANARSLESAASARCISRGPAAERVGECRGRRPSPRGPAAAIGVAASSVNRRGAVTAGGSRAVRRARRSGPARRSRASSRRPGSRPAAASSPSVAGSAPDARTRAPPATAGTRAKRDSLGQLPADLEVRVDARLDPAEQLQDQPVAVDDRRVALLALGAADPRAPSSGPRSSAKAAVWMRADRAAPGLHLLLACRGTRAASARSDRRARRRTARPCARR